MTLVTDFQIPEPDIARLQNVEYEPRCIDGRELAMITVQVEKGAHGPYGLLTAIADQLQINKAPLASAVRTGVSQFMGLLATRARLTPEEEIGLVGELIFLDFLIKRIGPNAAVSSWQGPRSEEHDFTFKNLDFEVKTTSSEKRQHKISGLTQLVPRPGVPLALVSIQVTPVGATEGESLPSLIARTRDLAKGEVTKVDSLLADVGWDSGDADLYSSRWSLRSTPRAYFVGPDFPVITPNALAEVIPNAALLSDISYRVDVTNLDSFELPEPFARFTETEVI